MNIGKWLEVSTAKLENAGIGTARLDCLVLLEDSLGKDRSWLLAHPETSFQDQALKKLDQQVVRRMRHEPLAYIRSKTEFYGREFYVNKYVLEPRPESETMIDLAIEVVGYRLEVAAERPRIIDVGTGSGALGITMKLEVPKAAVVAIDIDPKCLAVAQKNADKLGAKVKFLRGDLLEPISNLQPVTYNLVLANLPYVPDGHAINQAAMNEPRRAIFGGPDGLDIYRRLFAQIKQLSHKPRFVLTESLPFQHQKLAKIASSAHYKLNATSDFIQRYET